MDQELLSGARPRVFTTDPDDPEEGRIFVWTKMGWSERIEADTGAVAFAPIAESEDDLYERLAQEGIGELTELDDGYARLVREELAEEPPLYPEAPELSDEEPFGEQQVT